MDRREFLALAGGAYINGAVGLARPARARAQLAHPVTLYDPSGEALRSFHGALGHRRTRIMVWGASHVSEDGFTSHLRARLTARFGDAGPGLVLPARPFEFYDHREVEIAPTGRWRPLRVRGRSRAPDHYGPAGIAIETARAAAAFVRPRRAVETAHIFYLAQPGGGTVELSVNGSDRAAVCTHGRRGVRSHTLDAPALRELRLVTRGDGPVRIFGVSLERSQDGVIVDPLGSPGARFRDRLPWSDGGMARQLRELGPDLLVLAYGTNETGFRGRSRAVYRREVSEAVRRARSMSPDASCVIVGPSDWPERGPGGEWRARARTRQVIEVQREVAQEHGCGHFDLVALQGGPGSMPRWVRAGLALPDHVHFTDRGHRVLAAALERALVPGG